MQGGSGNDHFSGGTGADTLAGGTGNDLFVLRPDDNPGKSQSGANLITDCYYGEDLLDLLDGLTYADLVLQSKDVDYDVSGVSTHETHSGA